MGNLNGRVAVVTGGGKGIGAASGARFLQDGAAGIALLDYDRALVEATAKRLDPEQKRVMAFFCDVSKQEQVKAAAAEVVRRFGKIDILVNNAGITRDKMFHKMDEASWDIVLDINLKGAVNMCREIVPRMREQNYGRIVNLSSTSAYGNAGQTNYSASKAALIGFTKSLARENAPKNVTVNCVAPGFIDTDMFNAIPPDVLKEYYKLIPMNRLGRPEEVASVVSFFSSDDASFVSGQCLIISGASHT